MTPTPPSPFAFDLDSPAGQLAVLSYLKTLGECLERAADAVSHGGASRDVLIDELTTVQLLTHVLVHRLTEPAEPPTAPAATDATPPDAGATGEGTAEEEG